MNKLIHKYLDDLRAELETADTATLLDALSDAEEHLTSALQAEIESGAGLSDDEVIDQLITEYGSALETAEAYLLVEEKTTPAVAYKRKSNGNI